VMRRWRGSRGERDDDAAFIDINLIKISLYISQLKQYNMTIFPLSTLLNRVSTNSPSQEVRINSNAI